MFWDCYRALPHEVQRLADANYSLLKSDARHPSLQFKKVGASGRRVGPIDLALPTARFAA